MLNQNTRNRLRGLAQRSSAGEDLIERERYGSFGSMPEPSPHPATTPAFSVPYAGEAYSAEDVAGIPTLEEGPSVPINAGDRGERTPEVMPDTEPEERLESQSQSRSA
jgi:hypothetical protein